MSALPQEGNGRALLLHPAKSIPQMPENRGNFVRFIFCLINQWGKQCCR